MTYYWVFGGAWLNQAMFLFDILARKLLSQIKVFQLQILRFRRRFSHQARLLPQLARLIQPFILI